MWLLDVVDLEVRDASTKPQQAARSDPALEAADDLAARESPHGRPDRHAGLDGDGGAGREDPRAEAEERGGTASAPSGDARRADPDGDPAAAVPGGGGADQVLRAGAVLVRADRDGLDAGLHHRAGLRAADGRGRRAADQRGRGRASGLARPGRPQDRSRRHDRAGSSDSASQRDGAARELRPLVGVGGGQGRTGDQALCREGRGQAQGGEGAGAQVPPVRQDEGGQGSSGPRWPT